MSVGECGGGVNGDGDDRGEHPANIHRNFDYPVNVLCIYSIILIINCSIIYIITKYKFITNTYS